MFGNWSGCAVDHISNSVEFLKSELASVDLRDAPKLRLQRVDDVACCHGQ